MLLLANFYIFSQANYVGNPSFDDECVIYHPPYWPGLDSINCAQGSPVSMCLGNGWAPFNSFTFQYPKSGQGYIISTFFVKNSYRGYLKNRLKNKLQKDETYCVTFYVNITNNSTCGLDRIEACFVSKQFDTITSCHSQGLTFLNPQIFNPANNIITDTLNWVPIQGTFTAKGDECYMLIGNFKTDLMTNILPIVADTNTNMGTNVCVDDVSCIPIDLPADAGPDKGFFTGDSVFIGRTPDVGINEFCTWYKMPNLSTPIATVAGLYVKPVVTTTYVVRQQLWCSGVRWDTVVVYKDAVGIIQLAFSEEAVRVLPNPASQFIELQFENLDVINEFVSVSIFNSLGESVKKENLQNDIKDNNKKEKVFRTTTSDLSSGIYYLQVLSVSGRTITKKIIIQH